MKKTTKAMKISFILAALLIIIPSTLSIGISPVSQNIEPYSGEVHVRLVNTRDQPVKAKLDLQGELAEYFTKPNSTIIGPKAMEEITIPYSIPEILPGVYTINVIATELPDSEGTITALSSVVSEITLLVPYQDKRIDAKLYIFPKNDRVDFSIPVKNLGQDIENLYADIKIFQEHKNVMNLTTNTASLPIKTVKRLSASWPNPKEETYKAVATIHYDGNELQLENQFTSSNEFISIELISIIPEDNTLKLIFKAHNPLNTLAYASAEIQIIDQSENLIQSISTDKIPINSQEEQELTAFLDPQKYYSGKYHLNLKTFHNNNQVRETTYENAFRINTQRPPTIYIHQSYKEEKSPLIPAVIAIVLILLILRILRLIRKQFL